MGKDEFSGFRGFLHRSFRTLRREGPDRLLLCGMRYMSWKLQLHERVAGLPKPVARVVTVVIMSSFKFIIYLFRRLWPDKYTDADPYKRLHVDPASIDYTSGAARRRGWVVDGRWDQNGGTFMERTVPRAIEEHYVEGLSWDETALADKYEGAELEKRASEIEQLSYHIREEGYKSQRQLLEEDPNVAWNGLNDAMHPLANEIAVDIGRNGEILWNMCGQHRLALAKVLGIDEICVQVFRRHSGWQTIRDSVRDCDEIQNEYHNHPDLQDLTK